jgi:integral membrane protein
VGLAHGLLFVLFLFALMEVAIAYRWSFVRVVGAFVSSLVPFGTFVLDARLRREEAEAAVQAAP